MDWLTHTVGLDVEPCYADVDPALGMKLKIVVCACF